VQFNFTLKAFNELSVDELYQILQLRETVFVVEQNCIYHDIDGIDQHCYHLFAKDENKQNIIAYARLVPAQIKFDVPSIGRVISDKNYLRKGLGKALMNKALEEVDNNFKTNHIKHSVQSYILYFY